ncbi:MAG: hypothetical protein NWE92_03960 [Candidatus Bathyarchaeota archaeon]|nr:hypothetical protein [Candidatus Bathyarchaeota archaeon]
MANHKTAARALLILLISSSIPAFLILNGQGQVNVAVEEKMVQLAEQTSNQIQNLITKVYADEEAQEKIENASLTQQFEANVTIYQNEGLSKLSAAQEALANSNYDSAADSAREALSVFREVYRSLQQILETAGVQDNSALNNQELLDAINRELLRVETLQNLLPANATQERLTLETSKDKLLEAQTALQEGKYSQAQTLYLEAKQDITQIYQYLKTQAEESNMWRLSRYCESLQQRIQERFQYGSQNGVNFDATLQSLGYQSESQFMQALQNIIQNAQSQSDIKKAIEECTTVGQMVQQMEQALNQEINHQQGPTPSNGNSGTSGPDNGAGNTGGNSTNSGNNNPGNTGGGNAGKGGN